MLCLGVLSSRLTFRLTHRLVSNLHVFTGIVHDVIGNVAGSTTVVAGVLQMGD